ncbi:hypothetical protein GUITHDRAFT_145341 [Guillardia theta CCMP2712]|uniref:Uncharacterized protein n=1 Tax=Guillardia theta (strain CCMP2712) TaxID=905079 RepID=L1IMF8_GUITC|nr:hypothetical protein GUITHDRAFT_145341 [Guillardia theta CCMP2712]EKX36985.1 hypothetical protein GUITHDRAFT_145341 [Guillardia theta CCMP2712]|eukprot:XP_005823965.1 hypothetical protein GUITHDRAFT_145341 [Guillardia theta CCMP2712]
MGSEHKSFMACEHGEDEKACVRDRRGRAVDATENGSDCASCHDVNNQPEHFEQDEQAEMWTEYGRAIEDLTKSTLCPFIMVDLSRDNNPILFASTSMCEIDVGVQWHTTHRTSLWDYLEGKLSDCDYSAIENAMRQPFVEFSTCFEWAPDTSSSQWLHVSLRQDDKFKCPFVTICFYDVTNLVEQYDVQNLEDKCREIETTQLYTCTTSFSVLHAMMMDDDKSEADGLENETPSL